MSDKNVYCDPCEHHGKATPAEIWCNDCEERFCKECVIVHEIAKILRNHQLVPIDGFCEETSRIANHVCREHGKKIAFFCSQHDDMVCIKCIQSHHISCDVTELEEAAKGIKSSNAFTDAQETQLNILRNIEICNKVCNENESVLVANEARIKSDITEVRNNINMILDNLQEKLTQKLDSQFSARKRQINDFKSNLQHMEMKLKQVGNHISTFTMSSEIQTFVGLRQVQKSLRNEETVLKEMMNKFVPTTYKFLGNQKLQSFLKKLDTFGKITSETDLQLLQYVDIKTRQAQHSCSLERASSTKFQINEHVPTSAKVQIANPPPRSTCVKSLYSKGTKNGSNDSIRDVSKVHLTLRNRFQIQSGYFNMIITSCLILPNKKLMFADTQNKRLIIHNSDGSLDHYIKLTEKPFDIEVLDKKRVVVTYKPSKWSAQIDVIDIFSYKQSSFIIDDKVQAFWGISSPSEGVVFVVAYPDGIQQIDAETKAVTTIPLNPSQVFNISVHNSTIYFTKKDKNTLFSCDTSGKIIWKFRDEKMCCPNNSSISITTDENGNVYVVGMEKNIVILVSSNGENKKIVLKQSDKLDKPRGIHYDKVTRQLLVCNQENGLASLYDVEG